MEVWVEPGGHQPCFGVVIYGFENDTNPHCLTVVLGEMVQIRAESSDWYFVYKIDEDREGIIPKTFIHVQNSVMYQRTDSRGNSSSWAELIAESTEVLKEWHNISRQHYLTRHPLFLPMCRNINELHTARKEILSQSWTVEALKQLRKSVAHVIDFGNHILKLDITVRNDQGSPLDVKSNSAIQLYRQHLKTSERLEKALTLDRGIKISKHDCQSLLVVCEKLSWKVVDECEIRLFLYDAVEGRPFSEGGQVTLAANTIFSQFRFLFADLGKRHQNPERMYLIFYIVRIGSMDYREESSKRDLAPFSQKSSNQRIRRPWGVAARDISKLLNIEGPITPTGTAEESTLIPFYSFGDSDSMKSLLTKVIDSQQVKDSDKGFLCSLSLIPGTPVEVQEEQPLLMRGNPTVVRKMGFPEVILPNDVRNDLYVTLVSGEFHKGSKFGDKKIEVSVTVHNESGGVIPNIIFGGNGSVGLNQYRSVVYSDEWKPRWEETFKLTLPMSLDQFSKTHLKFCFKYRSSRESKDISEKPFALAYVRLRQQEKGTALPDGEHKLAIFKVDKSYRESDIHYLHLPAMLTGGHSAKRTCPGLTWSHKDSFSIRTTLCSTQFTQNDHLYELLQWSTSLKNIAKNEIIDEFQLVHEATRSTLCSMLLNNLKKTLQNVTSVSGEEIVKFLPYVFNALFSILVESVESIMNELFSATDSDALANVQSQLVSENCDRAVFDCLIYIFGLILDHKFQNFKSVLYHYIDEEFSATMAYTKLIKELVHAISNPIPDRVLKIMKSLEFFMKFIVRSFSIRIKLRDMDIENDPNAKEEEAEFERSIGSLFSALGALLVNQGFLFVNAQKGCLKYIPTVIEPLTTVFCERKLSELLVELLIRVEHGRLNIPKLTCIMDIVKSHLFQNPESRTTLLPIVAKNIKEQLPGNEEYLKRRSAEFAMTRSRAVVGKIFGTDAIGSHAIMPLPDTNRHAEETNTCLELLSEVMDILFSRNIGTTDVDISYMVQILLRDLIYSIGVIGDHNPTTANMVAILIALLRQMPSEVFAKFMYKVKRDSGITELFKFVNDALVVFKNLFTKPFFHSAWFEMIMLQNSVLLRAMEQFTERIRVEFLTPFELMPWNNFFQCAVSFLIQDSVQLETFSMVKKCRVISQYGDMRLRAAELIRVMWESLGERQFQFVPALVGSVLDMGMVPELTIRRITMNIFFEMIRCDFIKNQNFQKVEDELINRLVESIESGHGDPAFRNIFYENMIASCEEQEDVVFKEASLRMVDTVTKLLDILLEYREVIDDGDSGNRMTCIVNLLDFSMEVGRKELYLRYLYKLHDLHILSLNYTEAAFTLKLHSRQLEWTEDEVPQYLRSPKYPLVTTQVELKETLYKDIINYFDDENAKSWECAIDVCDELRQLYAEELFSYSQLPELLLRMSNLYEKILKGIRFEPGYFRVAFFGRGFPSFLQDRVFVYRGRRSERLNDFEARMLERFPHAELLRSLNLPSIEQRNAVCQLLQICNLEPVMNTDSNNKRSSGMKYAEESIRRYYRSNDVNKFVYSRPYHKEPKDPKNEFASLWIDRHTLWTASSFPGNMTWFPVIRESSTQVKPIQFGIETLQEANEKLQSLILAHCMNPQEDLGPLSLKLNGVLDAAVMGGVANYEKAFFCPEYLEREPDDAPYILTMKHLILAQVPLLSECLRIHREKAPDLQKPLHQKLEDRYEDFLFHLEDSYGDLNVNVREIKDEALQRDMDRVQKKRLALTRKDDRTKPHVITRNSEGMRAAGLTRSKSSFSSTLSVYSGYTNSKNSPAKSMVGLNRPGIIHRRSTQGSFDEGMGSSSGNLLRGNLFVIGSSMNKLSSIGGEDNEANNSSTNSTSSLHSQSQFNPRLSVTLDNGKNWNWTTNGNGDARSSGMSISSNRNSIESIRDMEDLGISTTPPPLPPKNRRELHQMFQDVRRPSSPSSPGPAPLPPKKPPLRNDQ